MTPRPSQPPMLPAGTTLATLRLPILPPPPLRRPRLATTARQPATPVPPPLPRCDDRPEMRPAPIVDDPCDCSVCGGTHRVVNAMGHERACDYCACAPEVSR